MKVAIELARRCPPSATAYAVGAVILDQHGQEIARGYSRETDPVVHAEEAALAKVPDGDTRLAGATIFSTLEPCSERRSRPRPCTQLILAAGIRRVVIAWREPALLVRAPSGVELLRKAGVAVVELPELADLAREPNQELFRGRGQERSTDSDGPV